MKEYKYPKTILIDLTADGELLQLIGGSTSDDIEAESRRKEYSSNSIWEGWDNSDE